jgi:hypothetical protein
VWNRFHRSSQVPDCECTAVLWWRCGDCANHQVRVNCRTCLYGSARRPPANSQAPLSYLRRVQITVDFPNFTFQAQSCDHNDHIVYTNHYTSIYCSLCLRSLNFTRETHSGNCRRGLSISRCSYLRKHGITYKGSYVSLHTKAT